MSSSGLLRRVALVRTDFSEERVASIIKVTGIGELGTTLAVTNNRSALLSLPRFSQEPHGVTSQKTAFFKEQISSISVKMKMSEKWNHEDMALYHRHGIMKTWHCITDMES
jgi:hypothetical protein